MTEPTIPVTRAIGQQAIDRILAAMPASWCAMPIGGVAVDPIVDLPGATTKDVDLVLVIIEGNKTRIPTAEQIVKAVSSVLSNLETRKDKTGVSGLLRLEQGTIQIELIRGRSAGLGGYFVPRNVLLVAAALGHRDGRVIRLPTEALAFLKAWAVTDQAKLVQNDRGNRPYHEARAAAFRRDVLNLHGGLLDKEKRNPDGRILEHLLKATGGTRRRAVDAVLRENGWSGALDETERPTRKPRRS